MSTESLQQAFAITADHPALAGHFPGRPVVPGVVLLDQLAAALERAGCAPLVRLDAVKFLVPLAPGATARLCIEREGARLRFRIDGDGCTLLRGEGRLADTEPGA